MTDKKEATQKITKLVSRLQKPRNKLMEFGTSRKVLLKEFETWYFKEWGGKLDESQIIFLLSGFTFFSLYAL